VANVGDAFAGIGNIDLFKEEKVEAEADSALHLALTNNAALNVDVILKKMSQIDADASRHFKDIFHQLVDYKNFKDYLHNMTKTTPEMDQHKILRVLKDTSVNICPYICFCFCCKKFKVNKDDEYVLQVDTQNTMIMNTKFFSGLSQDDIPPDDMQRYRCAPVEIKSVKFDWLMDKVSDEDRQPFVYRLLNEIEKKAAANSDEMEFYNIPVIQAMIRYHHGMLQQYIWLWYNAGLLALDLMQIAFQMFLVNRLFEIISSEVENESSVIVYDNTGRTNSMMLAILVFACT
jgi:hypothetical protein